MKTYDYEIINKNTGELVAWTDVDPTSEDVDGLIEERIQNAIEENYIEDGDYSYFQITCFNRWGAHI